MTDALFALAMTVLLIGAGAAPALGAATDDLDVSVAQNAGNVGVTVTSNDTGVANASVTVETVEANETTDNGTVENVTYDGVGSYETGADGTVSLPVPEEDVTVSVTAAFDNETALATKRLKAPSDDENETRESFGLRVSTFVQSLLDQSTNATENETTTSIGHQVATFVLANNPGNAPDHAGPSDDDRGPPEHAGLDHDNETDDDRGPPEHAGPDRDDAEEADENDDADEEDSEDEEENESETEEDETEDEDDDDDEEDDDDDGGDDDDDHGPPEHAGPPGDR